jgi:nicotinamide-nucleotide amidase
MELFNRKILDRIGKQLLKKKETIAVAESVTAGLLQFSFSTIPDAANFFQGGLTAYNLGQKFRHLDVEPIHAKAVNCVSQKVAKEMATHVIEKYASDWGIGITGYATPVPESDDKVFAYYSIFYKNKNMGQGKISPVIADPKDLQIRYVNEVLKKLSALL